MRTKYILVGGYPSKADDGGREFCEEIVRGFEHPVKILDCLFARPQETWSRIFEDDRKYITGYLPDKKLNFQLADPKNFIEQVRNSDAIYLRGGETDKLMMLLQKNKGWERYLEGKTIIGTSAGANVIAKYYYALHDLVVSEGLGLLSIKVIVHYRSDYNSPNIDWDIAYEKLKNHEEQLPIITLAEGQFKVVT